MARPPAAAAQDLTNLDLERLMAVDMDSVYGASRYLQKISEAPASITVITADEIRAYGHRTLADVLGSVRGIYVSNDRNYSYFGIRGLTVPGDYNSRVLVLIDGHRINDNIYDSILAGTEFPLDVDLIDRVEVIRGPGSALYGANAFSMVINIMTRRGGQVDGPEIAFETGTQGSRRGRLTFGKKYASDVELLISASGYFSRGEQNIYFPEFDAPETNDGIVADADRDRSKQVFASVSFGNLTIRTLYGGRRKQIPTASFGAMFNDPREQTTDRRSYAELQYGRQVGLTADVLARTYYDVFDCGGEYPFPTGVGSEVVMGFATCRGDTVGSELSITRRMRRQRLVFGAEYRANLRQNMATELDGLGIPRLDVRQHSTAWGLSASDEVQLHSRLVASGSVRLDHQSGYDARVTPRASLVVGPVARTHLKLLFADAFRAPSTNERFFEASSIVETNPLLEPETVRSLEAVVEHTVHSGLSLSASVYRTKLDGLITSRLLDSGATQLFNSNATFDGIELEARARVGAVAGDASYTFLRATDASGRPEPGAAPRHQAKMNAMTPLSRHLTGALQLVWSGPLETQTGETIESALISNLTLTKQNFWSNVDLGASIYNVFDQQARYPVSENHAQTSVPQYGRRFVGRLTWRF